MSELLDFKCPNCGGQLEFDSETQQLKCPYCDGLFDPETFNGNSSYEIKNDMFEDGELNVYLCHSCGGTIMADQNTAASSCPYCGNPVAMSGNLSGAYKPKKILPFKLDKEAAKKNYLRHISGKTLLPKAFSSQATIDEIKGIYVPFWIFDGTAQANMWYDATKSRSWSDSDYYYTETQYYELYRSGRVTFQDVPVDASSKLDDTLMQSIEPYDSKDMVDFNKNYLAGYLADKYDVEAETCAETARKRIMNSTASLFSSTTAGYETAVARSSNIQLTNGQQEYVMLPVWLLNVNYQGQKYTFAMNGQTGKFIGDLPADSGKLVKIVITTFIIVTAVLSAVQYFMM